MVNQIIYKKLIEVARAGAHKRYGERTGLITYSELNDKCQLGLDLGKDSNKNQLCDWLGKINEEEGRRCAPMISAVVVLKDSTPPRPGHGFFECAQSLGKMKPGQSEDDFYRAELKRVYEYWKNH